MQKTLLTAMLVAFSLPVFSAEITVDEMKYTPKEHRTPKEKLKQVQYHGSVETFADNHVIVTKGLKNALYFVDGQSQLSELRRNALKSLAYSATFIMQNAHDSVVLQKYSNTASNVANCGYFGLDDELRFIIEKMFSEISETGDDKARIITGSFELAELMPLYTNQKHIQESLMKCSENIQKWLQ